MGSFAKSHVAEIPDSNSSIDTQTVSLLPEDLEYNPFMDMSRKRTGSKQSKLRDLMQKIKSTNNSPSSTPFLTDQFPLNSPSNEEL